MSIRTRIAALTIGLTALATAGVSGADGHAHHEPHDGPFVLGYTMERIDGAEESLETHKGKVILMVNVASRCGLTPQYEGLQKLYESHRDRGFVILGFPANNFGNQEPGTNKQILEFCQGNYGVTFPMYAKISVKGDDQHDLYRQLTTQPEPIGGEVPWNFQKYLVDRSGNVVAKFGPRVKPGDDELVSAIEALLASG